ncbi:MAG: MGMT family protein [candidate division Zixibacteria bacterium]
MNRIECLTDSQCQSLSGGDLLADLFHQRVIRTIKRIPKGRVATYGQIAALCDSPRAARQVVRALHSSSKKEKLPWHRVINSKGRISLLPSSGFEEQKALLEREGIVFKLDGSIDLKKYQWAPRIKS